MLSSSGSCPLPGGQSKQVVHQRNAITAPVGVLLAHLDEGVGLGVEVKADGVAGLLGQHVRHHVRGVVSRDLHGAHALRGGPIVVLDHDRRRRLEAALRYTRKNQGRGDT